MPLQVLYDGKVAGGLQEAEIDIVAVHGLNPRNNATHGLDTWRKPRGPDGHLWLKDSLSKPHSLPTARTMLYIYNSSPGINPTKQRFIHEAEQFLACLLVKRYENPTRPLMLIGHSLGGILIKQALVLAQANLANKDIIDATFALVFMGTPHDGPADRFKIAFGKMCAKIAKKLYGNDSTDLMEALSKNSLFSDVLEANWRHQLEKYQIISCYETIDPIVPRELAVLHLSGTRETILAMNADHRDVCKFNPGDTSYQEDFGNLEANLIRLCNSALEKDNRKRLAIDETLKKDILESLGKFGHNPRFGKIEGEHNKTLQWIWTPNENGGPGFLDWLRNDEGLFWISGKPGAGKSTLMKFIHEDSHTMEILNSHILKPNRTLIISYFFHDLGSPLEKTFGGLLHALLFQILSEIPELLSTIQPYFEKLMKRSMNISAAESIWTEVEMQKAFADLSLGKLTTDTRILCIVDGLDECVEKQLTAALSFLKKLGTSTSNSSLKFKVLCSSRIINPIELAFSKFPSLRIHDWTYEDIANFVAAKFLEATDNLYPGDETFEVSEKIISKVVRKAEGVFVWVKLVVDELIMAIESGDIESLEQKLEELPSDLEDLYSRIIQQIPLSLRHYTFNYLQCLMPWNGNIRSYHPNTLLGLVFATQPSKDVLAAPSQCLTVKEIIGSCMKMKRVLQDRCRGFIHLPHRNPAWSEAELLENFCRAQISIHKTVKDYLFPSEDPKKLCRGISPDLLEQADVQRAAFWFRIAKLDPGTRWQVLPLDYYLGELEDDNSEDDNSEDDNSEDDNSEDDVSADDVPEDDKSRGGRHEAKVDEEMSLRFVVTDLLETLYYTETLQNSAPLAITLLPALESHLKTVFCTEEKLEDFYDMLLVWSYASLESYARVQPISEWHSDLLSVALSFGLESYVREKLRNLRTVYKKGRPLLHYAFETWDSYTHPSNVSLLLSKGASPDCKFDSRTTWEYMLVALYENDSRLEYHCPENLISFLEAGADPNQCVNLHDLQCSALHVILSMPSLPYQRLEPVLQVFLDKGADVTAMDSNGCTVVELASKNFPNSLDMLRRAEARVMKDNNPYQTGEAELEKSGQGMKATQVKKSLIDELKRAERIYCCSMTRGLKSN